MEHETVGRGIVGGRGLGASHGQRWSESGKGGERRRQIHRKFDGRRGWFERDALALLGHSLGGRLLVLTGAILTAAGFGSSDRGWEHEELRAGDAATPEQGEHHEDGKEETGDCAHYPEATTAIATIEWW